MNNDDFYEDLVERLPPDLSEPPETIGHDVDPDAAPEVVKEYRSTVEEIETLFEAFFERKDPEPEHASPFYLTAFGVEVFSEGFENNPEAVLGWIESLCSDDGPLQWHGVPGNVRVWSVAIGFKRELGVNVLRFINKQFHRAEWLEAPIPSAFVEKLDECPGPDNGK